MKLRDSGTGPAVIKIAGLMGGVELHREEIAHATRGGFRVGAFDPSGDRADDPASGALGWDTWTDEVVAAIDRLETERAVLWGTSFGSQIALATAARRPERVQGLLLCFPPTPGWRPWPWRAILRTTRAWPDRSASTMFRAIFFTLNGWEFAINPNALRRLPALARASAEARTPGATIRRKLELVLEDDPGLPGQELPVSIIAGALDFVVRPWGPLRLARMLPQARLRTIRLGGHGSAYTRPRLYNRWAVEELRRLWRSGQ